MNDTSVRPPPILQTFNSNLLRAVDTLGWFRNRLDKIKKKAQRKIRDQDTGRRRQFDRLVEAFEVVYGRLCAQKETYEAKKAEEGRS